MKDIKSEKYRATSLHILLLLRPSVFGYQMLSRATILAAVVAAAWVSVCDAIVVFPESVAEVGIFPFPLYFGGLPAHVVALFIAFYLVRDRQIGKYTERQINRQTF